jgi:hypothetical protein
MCVRRSSLFRASLAAAFIVLSATVSTAQCVPFQQAQNHIGATRCVSGKVLHVKLGNGGVHFFDYCEDFRLCPFTVVVFPGDLKQVGDVRRLEGRSIEVEGEVKGYDGRAEIILRRTSQLRGDAARLPPIPKEYDVERRGKFSAGTMRFPKKAKTTTTKKSKPPTTVIWDDPAAMEPD